MQDLLIIGGGFAGICCAQEAMNRGLSFTLVDNGSPEASTRVAAGIMNPISGRKYKLQWAFEDLWSSAINLYGSMEKNSGIAIMHALPIYKIHRSEEALEAWLVNRAQLEMPELVRENPPVEPWQKHLDTRFGALLVNRGMRIDTQAMLQWISNTEHYTQSEFRHADLQVHADHVTWDHREYRHVIFCEGYHVESNPWFGRIPMRPNKGECLIAHIPYLQCPVILQKNVFVVPLGNDRYWIGGTSDNDYTDASPSAEKADQLIKDLRHIVRLGFTVEEHQAAIRPTMRDRSPAVGTHHTHASLHILNGLGTKGSMLGPYYAQELLAHIFDHSPIPKGANINRFTY